MICWNYTGSPTRFVLWTGRLPGLFGNTKTGGASIRVMDGGLQWTGEDLGELTMWDSAPIHVDDHGMVGEGVKFERIRRITGYLVGTIDRFNNAKRAEEHDRIKHSLAKSGCWGEQLWRKYAGVVRFASRMTWGSCASLATCVRR